MHGRGIHRARLCRLCLLVIAIGATPSITVAQDAVETAEAQREQMVVDRFLELLLKRPTTGTALDRVFGHYVARGTLAELIERLDAEADAALEAGDEATAGRTAMVSGLLQLQRGEDAAAAEALALADRLLADEPLAAYHHGQALQRVGQNDAAAAALQRALDREPARRDLLAIASQLGRLHQRAGRIDEATAIWTELEARFPGDASVGEQIARTLAEEGDRAGALQRYDALAKGAKSPGDQVNYAMRAADLRLQMGEAERAIEDLEAMVGRLRPGSYLYAEARRRIEDAFLSSGDYAGLADYYAGWVEDHEDDVDAMLRLGRTLAVQGRGPEAREWFQRAIEKAPSDSAARLALIDALVGEQMFSEAVAQYEQLTRLEPENPDYLIRWGQLLIEDSSIDAAKRPAAAAAVWNRLAEARADDAVIQSQVADLLRGAEMTEMALAGYRRAIELAPDQPQYREYLGEYLHQLDRKDEALQVWRELAAGDRRTSEKLVRLAEVLHQFEQPEEALETMRQACQMQPTLEQRLRFAVMLREAESYDEALEQLELAAATAETVEERDQVFAASIEAYRAAGQLDDRIADAQQEADKYPPGEAGLEASEAWRRLAILLDAARRISDSLDAIDRAVAAAPESAETLGTAAQMLESAGRIGEAIERRRQLATIDTRFRSGHLQRLATLHMRLGQIEEALEVGRQFVSGSGGSIDSFRFYADLCGQAGREDEQIDTLRRCLRANPRSDEAMRLLAAQLGMSFKTDQAIQLHWQRMDLVEDLDDRRQIVRDLTDLYLRGGQLEQLTDRLEMRGRESGARRETVDLLATMQEAAGDYGLARETLESLLREEGRDTLLIERLVKLTEEAGEVERAVELQRELLRLSPGRQNESRLAMMLVDLGMVDEAEAIFARIRATDADPAAQSRTIDRLFAAGETEGAKRFAERAVEQHPEDWGAMLRLAVLQAIEGDLDAASESASTLIAMDVEEMETADGAKHPYQQRTQQTPQGTYVMPPLRILRPRQMYELQRLLDDRYGVSSQPSLPKPFDFGHARLMARWIVMKHAAESEEGLEPLLNEAQQRAEAADATTEDAWYWYETSTLAASFGNGPNYTDPDGWDAVWNLVDADPSDGPDALQQLLQSRVSMAQREDQRSRVKPLPQERLEWLAEKAAAPADANSLGRVAWPTIYETELRLAGHEEEAQQWLLERIESAIASDDADTADGLLTTAARHASDEQLRKLMRLALQKEPPQNAARSAGSSAHGRLLSVLVGSSRSESKITERMADAANRALALELIAKIIDEEADQPVRRRTIRMGGVGAPRQTYRIEPSGNYVQVLIEYPPQGLGPNDPIIVALHTLWRAFEGHRDELVEQLKASAGEEHSRRSVIGNICLSAVLQWQEQTPRAVEVLADTAEWCADAAPDLEQDIRLLAADLHLRSGNRQQALKTIEGLTVYDQQSMAVRELAAARLSAVLGDQERAQQAARRLFGVRLDTQTQIELSKLMRSLKMDDLAADLIRRMQSRGGSNTTQLSTLLQYFQSQGDQEQAAEVAMAVLRRVPPSRNRSSNITTSVDQQRRTALAALAAAGRLQELIESTKERLERAPQSSRIRGELAEMYTAAGQPQKAQELLATAIEAGSNSLAAMEAQAKQMLAANQHDVACDLYLKILPRKPQLFQNDYYEIKRPFEQTKRLPELGELLVEVGVQRFESYRVTELAGELVRCNDEKSKQVAKQVALAVLRQPPGQGNNRVYSVNQIAGRSSEWLKDAEVFAALQDFLIGASRKEATSWSVVGSTYSYDQSGRISNAATSLIATAADDTELTAVLEKAITEGIEEQSEWLEGRALLGMLQAHTDRHAEARETLAFLLEEEVKPAPTYEACWAIGSSIDTQKPLLDLAFEIYNRGIDAVESSNYVGGREFQYSLPRRLAGLLIELDRKSEAREILVKAANEKPNDDGYSSNNADYMAYRQIRTAQSIAEMMLEADAAVDALRLCRNLDRGLFETAARYGSNAREQFEQRQQQALEAVRKLGGLAPIEAMIDESAGDGPAVDLAINLGNQPFSDNGLSSLFVEFVAAAEADSEVAGEIASYAERMKKMAAERPSDLSAQLAWGVLADANGNAAPLRELAQRLATRAEESEAGEQVAADNEEPPAASEAKESDDAADGAVAVETADPKLVLAVAMLRIDARGDADDRQRVRQWVGDGDALQDAELAALVSLCLGQRAAARSDTATAEADWTAALDWLTAEEASRNEPSLVSWKTEERIRLMTELAIAAAELEVADVSYRAAIISFTSDQTPTLIEAVGDRTDSLGALLGQNTSRTQSSPFASTSSSRETQDASITRRLLDLEELWRKKNLDSDRAYEALIAIVFPGSDGAGIQPLALPPENDGDKLAVASLFARLARRAAERGDADGLIERIGGAESQYADAPLLIAYVLLRDGRGDAAAERLKDVAGDQLAGFTKDLALQVLVEALENDAARGEALRLGLALIDAHKPTQRYAAIQPLDQFALHLADSALASGDDAAATAALNQYLALTQHDNERYSGSSAITRRLPQLDQVCRRLLTHNRTAEALRYVAMREGIFAASHDRSSDWIGSWIMEQLTPMEPERAYEMLADWTLRGDGPLGLLAALADRQPLPDWIPPEIGGYPPSFPPAVNATLPLVTSLHLLAEKAKAAGRADELLERLEEAQQAQRAGADEALAIALVANGREVPDELLERIVGRMEAIIPQPNQATEPMPFAAMQVALQLYGDAAHAEWTRRASDAFFGHANGGRDFIKPMLNRFRYGAGWTDYADLQVADSMAHFIASSEGTAKNYATTATPLIWLTDGQTVVRHLSGPDNQRLYLRYPLQGSFRLEVELRDGDWREMGLVAQGLEVEGVGHGAYVNVSAIDDRDWLRYATEVIKPHEWNRFALAFDDESMTYEVNDIPVYREARRLGNPWLALKSFKFRTAEARNLKITGTPTIPREIDMLPDAGMRDWSGQYFGQPLPTVSLTAETHEPDGSDPQRYRTAGATSAVDTLSWTVRDGELVSGKAPQRGPGGQSVVRYSRPLGDGEEIRYEFFYEPGKVEVHPSIGRTALVLRPDGVRLHWMLEPSSTWQLPADHEAETAASAAGPLPLKGGEWNAVVLRRSGDALKIELNGEQIFDGTVDLETQGAIFGLFHYADSTEARVRNLRFRGDWPAALPENLYQN